MVRIPRARREWLGSALALGAIVAAPCAALAASAAPSTISPDGQKSARLLQRAARQMHPIYGAPGSRQAGWTVFAPSGSDTSAVQQSAYEFSATVDGRVSSGGEDMLMLRVGDGRGGGLDAMIPHDLYAPWLDSGSQLRVLARPSAQAKSGDDDLNSRADCVVVAVAPEPEVLLLEHPQLAAYANHPPVLARSETVVSRSAPYERVPVAQAQLTPGHPVCALSPAALAAYPLYRNQIHRINPRLDGQTLDKITSSILGYSDHYSIDPRLIVAMMIAESHFDPNCVSRTGAVGLGQLMPGTAGGFGRRSPRSGAEHRSFSGNPQQPCLRIRRRERAGSRPFRHPPADHGRLQRRRRSGPTLPRRAALPRNAGVCPQGGVVLSAVVRDVNWRTYPSRSEACHLS